MSKSGGDIADKLNGSLPVQITSDDVERYTELMKLLTSLSQSVGEDGMSVLVSKELKEAEETMRHEKLKWLQQKIIYTELQELLLDHQLSGAQGTPSSNNQFYKAAQECLTFAEIGDYLNCHPDPSSDATLLGLKKNDIERTNPHAKHLPSIQQKLIPEIEQRLRKKCETLANFHDTSDSTGESGKFAFAKASQLPATLEADKSKLHEQKKQLKKDKATREKQFWQYYQALVESLRILEQVISRHRLHSQADCDTITSEWLTARCDAMCLKIKMLELQLLCDTYYADTVEALTTIRNQLDLSIHETQQELQAVSHSLQAYASVGGDFEAIVQEYTVLREELENKRWALREFKQNAQTPGEGLT